MQFAPCSGLVRFVSCVWSAGGPGPAFVEGRESISIAPSEYSDTYEQGGGGSCQIWHVHWREDIL
jgi:hypothetical protein